MKTIFKLISLIGLVLTLLPSILVFNGTITLDNNKWLMMVGTILWFASVPFWMNKKA